MQLVTCRLQDLVGHFFQITERRPTDVRGLQGVPEFILHAILDLTFVIDFITLL